MLEEGRSKSKEEKEGVKEMRMVGNNMLLLLAQKR